MKKGSGLLRRAFWIFSGMILLAGILLMPGLIDRVSDQVLPENASPDRAVTTLHFIHWGDFPSSTWETFNQQHPGIRVEAERYGLNQYEQVLMTRKASGDPIDVMGVEACDYSRMNRLGELLDLTGQPLVEAYDMATIQRIGNMDPAGGLGCVPLRSRAVGIWYNRILFDKYGLAVPGNAADFDAVCAALARNGVRPLLMGCRDERVCAWMMYLRIWPAVMASGSIDPLSAQPASTLYWKLPVLVPAFEETEAFVRAGYLAKESANLTYEQAFSNFINGQSAMCLAADDAIAMIPAEAEKITDLGVFPIPCVADGQEMSVPADRADWLTGIPSSSAHKPEAQLLLAHLGQADTVREWVNALGMRSPLKDAPKADTRYETLWDPLFQFPATPTVATSFSQDRQKRIAEAMRGILLGGTAGEAMEYLDGNWPLP